MTGRSGYKLHPIRRLDRLKLTIPVIRLTYWPPRGDERWLHGQFPIPWQKMGSVLRRKKNADFHSRTASIMVSKFGRVAECGAAIRRACEEAGSAEPRNRR
jgi:hypothetical protein